MKEWYFVYVRDRASVIFSHAKYQSELNPSWVLVLISSNHHCPSFQLQHFYTSQYADWDSQNSQWAGGHYLHLNFPVEPNVSRLIRISSRLQSWLRSKTFSHPQLVILISRDWVNCRPGEHHTTHHTTCHNQVIQFKIYHEKDESCNRQLWTLAGSHAALLVLSALSS